MKRFYCRKCQLIKRTRVEPVNRDDYNLHIHRTTIHVGGEPVRMSLGVPIAECAWHRRYRTVGEYLRATRPPRTRLVRHSKPAAPPKPQPQPKKGRKTSRQRSDDAVA